MNDKKSKSQGMNTTPGELNEDFEEPGRWLEIDGETIIGIHSHKCQSELTWVNYKGGGDVKLGDLWKNNKIVSPKIEIDEEQIRLSASKHIARAYPVWKQLNVLREGDPKKIEKMSRFIDATRRWSNDPKAKIKGLDKIKP
jgi:hypothetical protein